MLGAIEAALFSLLVVSTCCFYFQYGEDRPLRLICTTQSCSRVYIALITVMYVAQIFLTIIDMFKVITFMNTSAAFKLFLATCFVLSLLGDKR